MSWLMLRTAGSWSVSLSHPALLRQSKAEISWTGRGSTEIKENQQSCVSWDLSLEADRLALCRWAARSAAAGCPELLPERHLAIRLLVRRDSAPYTQPLHTSWNGVDCVRTASSWPRPEGTTCVLILQLRPVACLTAEGYMQAVHLLAQEQGWEAGSRRRCWPRGPGGGPHPVSSLCSRAQPGWRGAARAQRWSARGAAEGGQRAWRRPSRPGKFSTLHLRQMASWCWAGASPPEAHARQSTWVLVLSFDVQCIMARWPESKLGVMTGSRDDDGSCSMSSYEPARLLEGLVSYAWVRITMSSRQVLWGACLLVSKISKLRSQAGCRRLGSSGKAAVQTAGVRLPTCWACLGGAAAAA